MISFSELTVFDVGPLLLLEVTFQVLELVFSIGLPGDVIVVDSDRISRNLALVINWCQAESVVEETLGNQAAWVCRIVISKVRGTRDDRFAEAGVLVGLDRVAVV